MNPFICACAAKMGCCSAHLIQNPLLEKSACISQEKKIYLFHPSPAGRCIYVAKHAKEISGGSFFLLSKQTDTTAKSHNDKSSASFENIYIFSLRRKYFPGKPLAFGACGAKADRKSTAAKPPKSVKGLLLGNVNASQCQGRTARG